MALDRLVTGRDEVSVAQSVAFRSKAHGWSCAVTQRMKKCMRLRVLEGALGELLAKQGSKVHADSLSRTTGSMGGAQNRI
jgi:plasmid replication initiation protein